MTTNLGDGVTTCLRCGTALTDETICCSTRTHDDGTHEDGVCKACCTKPATRAPLGGSYERMDCDR